MCIRIQNGRIYSTKSPTLVPSLPGPLLQGLCVSRNTFLTVLHVNCHHCPAPSRGKAVAEQAKIHVYSLILVLVQL